MSHLDILLPFAIPPAEIARDLLRELKAPALAQLLSRAKSGSNPERERFDGFHRALPHETWLARTFNMRGNGSPKAAPALMQAFGLPQEPGNWFVLQPVHIHIARDHLVLTDPRQLALEENESRELFGIAEALFVETGKPLRYGDASTWFVRADDWAQLETSTPDAAGGRNIDIWMPSGAGERDWRKVQNEVQMHWFTHAVNAGREARGQKTINSIWLWGSGSAADRQGKIYDSAFNLSGWMRSLAQSAECHSHVHSANEVLTAAGARSFACLDTLMEPALASDWMRWLDAVHALEAAWFAPLLDALKSGKLSELALILSDDAQLARFAVTRTSLRKFWVSPTLASLTTPAS